MLFVKYLPCFSLPPSLSFFPGLLNIVNDKQTRNEEAAEEAYKTLIERYKMEKRLRYLARKVKGLSIYLSMQNPLYV